MSVQAFVGLGANLGNARLAIETALQRLESAPGILALRASSLYRSAPVDAPADMQGDDYVNAVAQVETTLTAPALLQRLQALEQQAGRTRTVRNAARTLDLDLLLYGAGTIFSPSLIVPHPRMWQRAFVLLPLRELAPQWVGPHELAGVASQELRRLP